MRIDDGALSQGVLVVEFEWPLNGKLIPLRAVYPDSFPRLRPDVRLLGDPSEFPRRHCGPIDGTLCLLGRDSRQWVEEWTLRDLLQTQLADALNDTGDEDPQGEPAEYWWNGCARPGSYFVVDSAWSLNGATSGDLEITYRLPAGAGSFALHAVVTEIRDRTGRCIQDWTAALPTELSDGATKSRVPWIYIDETILPNGRAEQIDELMTRFEQPPPWTKLTATIGVRWFAVVYKMEVGFGKHGLGWLFAVYSGSKKAFRTAAKKGHNARPVPQIIPTYRAGESDLGARVPAVAVLRTKKVAVVGLGAIGAPLAVELARNGCQVLHVVDYDSVEPGNAIRWPLGSSAWSYRKSEVIAASIRREYPWTAAKPHDHAIGRFNDGGFAEGDDALFQEMIQEVDLVVDATASYGVSTTLSDCCRAFGIPLVSLYASPSVEGGVVARFSPESGCPTCLEFAYCKQHIKRAPGFEDQERGLQQPPGCSERTFTGASFDLQELSLQAMRLIVETLANPDAATESVVHSLSFLDDGRRIPPRWLHDMLPKDSACSCVPRA